MAPTRKRTRKTSDVVVIPEKVVIKTEVIDEGYEKYYTPFEPVTVKTENVDPSQVIIKQEPRDADTVALSLSATVKTEDSESEQSTKTNSNHSPRKSNSKNQCERAAAGKGTSESSNGFSNNENIENLATLRETRSRKSTVSNNGNGEKTPNKRTRQKRKQNELDTTNSNEDSLKGCILHMKNILEVSKHLNNCNNNNNNLISGTISEDKISKTTAINEQNQKETPDKGNHLSLEKKTKTKTLVGEKTNKSNAVINKNGKISPETKKRKVNLQKQKNSSSEDKKRRLSSPDDKQKTLFDMWSKIKDKKNATTPIVEDNNNKTSANNNISLVVPDKIDGSVKGEDDSVTDEKSDKKLRLRVEALIPKDLRFPVGNYKCHSCDVDFKFLSMWEDHIINFLQYKGCFPSDEGSAPSNQKFKGGWIQEDVKRFLCKNCPFETKHKQDIYQHITAKHDPQSHKCALCTKTFNTLHYLKNHLSYKHDPTRAELQCLFCDYKTIDKYSLATHERTKHTKTGYLKCDQCDVQTPTKYKMRLHILRAHSSDIYKKKIIKCAHCSYTTNEYKRLREHVKRSHLDNDLYSCAYCSYKGSKYYLEIHISKMHMKDQIEKKYKCEVCDKKFPSESGLLTHNRIIHSNGMESFSCKHCSVVFSTKHDLFIHTNVVHLSKPEFQCNECQYWAGDKDKLREHVFRKHRLTFFCAYCPFKTHAKLYIYLHINCKHNPNSKRYKCSNCKYITKNLSLLKQHVNVKHNPNPILYTCFHCGHQNKIKHKLSQHMQNKHLNMKKKNKKITTNTVK